VSINACWPTLTTALAMGTRLNDSDAHSFAHIPVRSISHTHTHTHTHTCTARYVLLPGHCGGATARDMGTSDTHVKAPRAAETVGRDGAVFDSASPPPQCHAVGSHSCDMGSSVDCNTQFAAACEALPSCHSYVRPCPGHTHTRTHTHTHTHTHTNETPACCMPTRRLSLVLFCRSMRSSAHPTV
jgi:hypothetical protein